MTSFDPDSFDGRKVVRFVVKIEDRPSWLEVKMLERLERKLRVELGSPSPEPTPKKPDPPKDDKRCNVDGTSLVHRDDDTEETARRRAEVFYQRTYPILDFYQKRGISVEIDGQGSIAQVRERVREALAGSTKGVA